MYLCQTRKNITHVGTIGVVPNCTYEWTENNHKFAIFVQIYLVT